ncbi:hypothetical protein FSP39_019436 [Pinctada imbricata]|uniref:Protein very KIND n=1 Tax=Pinctada imbricata TaxID=66713 RepID=A0AA89C5S3_PINIB|nr:hypothetical protein FSP39_019436 [Pinctada imbricata]
MDTEFGMEGYDYHEDEEEMPDMDNGDEAISLYDVLADRDSCLNEEELWALCRECCLVLEVVNNSPDMFQTLCVTPDTVAFDGAGNVCFLDLDKDPEALYIPPEYSENATNSYKSHLFSLGMTLLYAAEYNGTPRQNQISAELRELFGCMTSEDLQTRPNLESVITQCEEELCGKSSQEVCCGIAAYAVPYTPAPDINSVSLADVTEGLANYLTSQSSFVQTSNDLSVPGSPAAFHALCLSIHTPTIYNPNVTNSKSGFSDFSDRKLSSEKENDKSAISLFNKEAVNQNGSGKTTDLSGFSFLQNKPVVPRKPSPAKFESIKKSDNDSGMVDDSHVTSDLDTPYSSKIGNILSGSKLSTTSQDLSDLKNGVHSVDNFNSKVDIKPHDTPDGKVKDDVEVRRSESEESGHAEAKPRRSKKKQGLTINEALDSLNRDLKEEELWSLCREGALALQRKKRHLPAYLSPDTLLLRENGNLSFKAIPEDKPLEVIFMAPELQQKGQLTDKTCLYGLGVTLRCAGGKKYSSALSMEVSPQLQDFLGGMGEADPTKRPSLEETIQFCDAHERTSGLSSTIICKELFQEAFTKLMEKPGEPPSTSLPVLEPASIPKPKPKPPPKPPSPMLSAFRPVKLPTTKPQIGSGSAFAPVPIKADPKAVSTVPTAYTSPATHFKPIVLHKSATPSVDNTTSKSQEKKSEEKLEVKDQPKDQPNEKDKEVVRKLKELKKNLMKHRQPGLAKDIENEDKEPTNQSSAEKKVQGKPKDDSNEVKASNQKSSSSIDALLSDMQKQGAVLDTQTLASAIAQHLQTLLPKGVSASPQSTSQTDLNITQNQTNPILSPPQQNQMFQNLNSQLPNLNIPTQYQQQLIGQTMTLPPVNQYGAGILPGYPMQVQLQQDPRTGFFQLVPVGLVQMGGSGQGSRAASDEFITHNEDMNESGRSSKQGSRAGSDTLPRARQGRTARDLVQKTAGIRAKNTQQGISNSPNSSRQVKDSGAWRPRSAHGAEHSGLAIADQSLGAGYNEQAHRTRSNSSSPSPSKDSGVSGLNGVYKPPPPGSLMERLLNSNVSLSQQKKIGRVVHLLREEFAFDGYMENGVEDVNMAEYITSLGNLKWETFISAITEKYPDLYWSVDLLVNMFESINGIKPMLHTPHAQRRDLSILPNKPELPEALTDHVSVENSQSDSAKARSYRKRTADSAFNRSRGIRERPVSAHALSPSLDTSDSTDTESLSRQARHRKKPLQKPKSASMHNLANMEAELTVAKDIDIQNEEVSPKSHDIKSEHSHNVPRDRSSPLIQNTHINVSSTHRDTPSRQRRRSDLQINPVKRDDSQLSDKPQLNRKTNSNNNSFSSRSSSVSDVRNMTKLSRHLSQISLNDGAQEPVTQHRRTQVVYHYATMQLSMTEEVEKFVQDIDEENADKLQAQLASLQQQVMMERRTKRKTQTFYNKLVENPKAMKGDQKLQVSKDLQEMCGRIRHLLLCQTHIEMLQAELHSIDPSYLYSLASNPVETSMKLRPSQENILLQYHALREPQSGCEIQMVQAGTVEGLVSYLFASTSLSFGYVHQFFYGFRYFILPKDLFAFMRNRYVMVSKSKIKEANFLRIKRRIVDLVHFWVEGFYSVDFEEDSQLQEDLNTFLEDFKISSASEDGQKLCELLKSCQEGHSVDLLPATNAADNIHLYKPESHKKWDSLKAKIRGKSGGSKDHHTTKPTIMVSLDRSRGNIEDVYFPKAARRTDAFTLADFTAQCMAQQLTLIEQGMFQMTHPVHYLKSKSLGVSVTLTMAGTRAPSLMRLNSSTDDNAEPSQGTLDAALQRMINHTQDVSHWVAAEILSCSSTKNQVAILSKLLQTAQICKEMRNYATSMAILDGLENIIIKQLPTWKNLPSKYVTIMEELASIRMFLKNDAMSLMNHKGSHLLPTIPSVLLFLIHVQQLEIGSFQLANEMYKWGKIRSIVEVIDQIRMFKDQVYGYEADYDMQDNLMQRIREFSGQDIHTIASQHDTNYQKISSSSGIGAAFRKMKGKFQSK